jgi:hypothetical protein
MNYRVTSYYWMLFMTRTDRWAKLLAGITLIGVAIGFSQWRRVKAASRTLDCDRKGESRPSRDRDEDSEQIIERLTIPVLRQRIGDIYREGYLTVLAIIQGVALAVLISDAQGQWTGHSASSYRTRVVTQAVALLAAIVVTTHRYMLLTVLGRWVPTIYDTLIPYALGVAEITAAVTLGSNVLWWSSMAFFAVSAVASFGHSRIRIKSTAFGEMRQLYGRFQAITLIAIINFSSMAAYSVGFAILSQYDPGLDWFYAATPIIALMSILVIEVVGSYGL